MRVVVVEKWLLTQETTPPMVKVVVCFGLGVFLWCSRKVSLRLKIVEVKVQVKLCCLFCDAKRKVH